MEKREFTEQALADALKVSSGKTINETFALDIPVVIVENEGVYKLYSDGRKEYVESLKKLPRKRKGKKFVLKGK